MRNKYCFLKMWCKSKTIYALIGRFWVYVEKNCSGKRMIVAYFYKLCNSSWSSLIGFREKYP